MKRFFYMLLLIGLTFIQCKDPDRNVSNNFISRIHTSNDDVDWYTKLGKTTLEKHISDFKRINWETDYWDQYNSDQFNFPDLEVMDSDSLYYLSISVCPSTPDTFQFCIAYGIHQEYNIGNTIEVKRVCKVFGSSTTNYEKPIHLISLFFQQDFKAIKIELNKMHFLYNVNDLFLNLN